MKYFYLFFFFFVFEIRKFIFLKQRNLKKKRNFFQNDAAQTLVYLQYLKLFSDTNDKYF